MTALLHEDFAVETATDGMEAIEKLRTNSYGVIVLDLLMPPETAHPTAASRSPSSRTNLAP